MGEVERWYLRGRIGWGQLLGQEGTMIILLLIKIQLEDKIKAR